MLLKSNREAVAKYKNARGSIETKYTPDQLKDLIRVDFEEMDGFDDLTRRAQEAEYEYLEDMVDGEEEEEGVTIHDVEDMIY